ncbi:MAG: hypothetical protein ACI9T8_000476 [Candidatus Saccharimonadales bacterium]
MSGITIPKVRTSVISAIFSLVTLIGFGTWMFKLIEEWTWAESFYFSVATLTTVGYGDIHPTSDGSRVFTAIFILLGVGIVIAALSRIGSTYLIRQEHQLSDNIARRVQRREHKND